MGLAAVAQGCLRGGTSHVFVAGSSRSGTHLTAQLLDRHPEVTALPELHAFDQVAGPGGVTAAMPAAAAVDFVAGLIANHRDYAVNFAGLTRPSVRAHRPAAAALLREWAETEQTPAVLLGRYLTAQAAAAGSGVGCDHTPQNVYYLSEVLAALPSARAVVMVRDPRAVLASAKHKWRARRDQQPFPWRERLRLKASYHPVTTTLLWRAATRATGALAGHDRVRVVRFEDLVASPGSVADEICQFLGLRYQPSLIEVTRANSSYARVAEDADGIDRDANERWRQPGVLSAAEVALCERLAHAEMLRLGYPLVDAQLPTPAVAGQLAMLPAHLAIAFALNARRQRSLRDALVRRLGTARGLS